MYWESLDIEWKLHILTFYYYIFYFIAMLVLSYLFLVGIGTLMKQNLIFISQ